MDRVRDTHIEHREGVALIVADVLIFLPPTETFNGNFSGGRLHNS